MGFTPLMLRPGVSTQATPLLNEAGYSASQLIRFRDNMLEKLGGWQRFTSTSLVGTCRALLPWADLNLIPYLACGTEQRLEVFTEGQIFDITPIRQTSNLTNPFTTTSLSTTVSVNSPSHNANTGDWMNVIDMTAVGGIVLSGFYLITVVDANNYTITAANPATSSTTGGSTALFTTTLGSNSVNVTINNHGLSAGGVYTVGVSTTVGGLTLTGQYVIQTVVNANNFTIQTVGAASSSTTGSENGGLVRIQYLLGSGFSSSAGAGGYGLGGYGLGTWGIGGLTGATTPIRQWSFGAWGYQLIAAPTNGGMYLWDPTLGLFNNPATTLSGAPAYNTGLFIAMPERQIVSYGAQDPGTGLQDPMLVRFCDVDNYNDWTATVTNQAGSFRLPRGSKIVGGLQGPQFGLLWTDLALWQMLYIQPPLVYGFNEIASGCGLISKRACGILGGIIVWMSFNGFFTTDGSSVNPLPCSVWDILFDNLNAAQAEKITLAPNSHFNEFFLFYPSLSGSGENDSYVKFTKQGNVWDYGSLVRTAWFDQSIFTNNNPIGVDGNALIQQHESTTDADGSAMLPSATTGWMKLSEGTEYIFLERFIPDFKSVIGSPSVQITLYFADYPNDTPTIFGPYTVTSSTEYQIVRARGRLLMVKISSSDLGTNWRLGQILHNAKGAGRR